MGHGSLLAGRYRLAERVRTGPDGSLWRAVDETLDRPVSVRVVRPGHRYTADVVDAARRAALVEDPRLVRVLDVGESDGSAYIVAEHLVGRTLEEILTDGPLPAQVARRLVGEAAEALDRASARGLHHLRLSPAVVVVAPDGGVKVLGTAVEAALAGVEQDEDPYGADRQDAVGLVRVLYAVLTARWPGPVEGPLGGAVEPAGRTVPPGDLVPGVPNDLDTLCAVTLGPHDDGPHTPGELARQLAPWPAAEPVPGRWVQGGPASGTPSAGTATAAATATAVAATAPAGSTSGPTSGPMPGHASARHGNPSAGSDGEYPTLLPRASQRTSTNRPPDPARPPDPPAARPARPPRPVTVPPPVLPGAPPLGGDRPVDDPADVWSMLAAARPEPGPPPSRRPVAGHRAPPDDAEPLGPFLPPTSLARPPRDQARFVIVVLAGVVVIGLVLAVIGLVHGVSSSPPLAGPAPGSATGAAASSAGADASPTSSPAGSPSVTGAASGSPSGSATGSPTGSETGEPATIVGVEAIDPQGDGSEGGGTASRAIDEDPSTTWRSDRYRSSDFGGLKQGLGLFLRVSPGRVTSIRVSMSGSGGAVELRSGAGFEGSTVLATASAADGVVVLTPTQPVPTGPLLLWFTSVPQQPNGEYRIVVSEIALT